jgi:hypothetical protein
MIQPYANGDPRTARRHRGRMRAIVDGAVARLAVRRAFTAAGLAEGDLWILESTSPGNLARVGWTRTSVKTNDRVEILVSPLRDGGHGGRCRMLTFLDRKEMLEC